MYANVNQFSSTNDLSISIMLRCVIFVQSNMYPYKWIDHTLYHISLFFFKSEIFHFKWNFSLFFKKSEKKTSVRALLPIPNASSSTLTINILITSITLGQYPNHILQTKFKWIHATEVSKTEWRSSSQRYHREKCLAPSVEQFHKVLDTSFLRVQHCQFVSRTTEWSIPNFYLWS